jgi:hypothetical protein
VSLSGGNQPRQRSRHRPSGQARLLGELGNGRLATAFDRLAKKR